MLGISLHTVGIHVKAIYRKLEVIRVAMRSAGFPDLTIYTRKHTPIADAGVPATNDWNGVGT